MPDSEGRVRIGILGASSFAPTTMINPAKGNRDVVLSAVASRDQPSADEFAAKYGIPKAYGSYEALIDDPHLDAIYVLVPDRKSTRLNSSHIQKSRMPSSA